MLKVENLHCEIDGQAILKGLNIELIPGKIHVLMGPNGSGKSTLAKTLMGHPSYEVTQGLVELDGEDMIDAEVDEKSQKGLFMAFQYPVEVPGVHFTNFLRMAYNSRQPEGKKMPIFKFNKLVREKAELLGIEQELLDRNLNEGLSGGEKKKAEILQLAVLNPKYVILDETDSGLDLDALKIIFTGLTKLQEVNPEMSFLIITHYQRIFDYIKPDHVHIMYNGKVVKEGGMELVDQISKEGYSNFKK